MSGCIGMGFEPKVGVRQSSLFPWGGDVPGTSAAVKAVLTIDKRGSHPSLCMNVESQSEKSFEPKYTYLLSLNPLPCVMMFIVYIMMA